MKERKMSKESLLKKYKKMFACYGSDNSEKAVAMIKDFDVERIRRIVNIAEMMRVNIERNKMNLDYADFKKFPKRVQKEVISVLGAYNECNVSFEFGKWEVSPSVCIKSYYHKDHRFFGTFYFESLVDKVAGVKKARKEFDDWNEKYRPDYSW